MNKKYYKWIIGSAAVVILILGIAVMFRRNPGKKQELMESLPVHTTAAPSTAAEMRETEIETVQAAATEKRTVIQTIVLRSDETTEATREAVESIRAVCELCNGTGWISCPTCHGKGLLMQTCAFCKGSGQTDICHTCDGSGVVYDPGTACPYCTEGQMFILPEDGSEGYYEDCPYCDGTGVEREEGEYPCTECGGSGHLEEAAVCPDCGGSGEMVIDTCPDCFEDENGIKTGMIRCPACKETETGKP